MQATPQAQFEVPEWMQQLGLGKSDWLNLSKAQLRTQQRPGPGHTLKGQVWATGMLHAPGYKGQEATTMRGGKRVPLTSGDIIRELWEIAIKYYADAGVPGAPTKANPHAKDCACSFCKLKETKEDIRQCLRELEEDGMVMRTDLNGTPLRELSREQLRRLPSGKTRMYFWLTPKAADPERVKREWENRQPAQIFAVPEDSSEEAENPEVGLQSLPLPPIHQILKALKIDGFGKEQITAPTYQKTIERAWTAARNIFLEVVSTDLPQVAPTGPPQVGATGGALESEDEIRVVLPPAPRPAASQVLKSEPVSSSSRIDDDALTPDPAFGKAVIRTFTDYGKPNPNPRQLATLEQSIPNEPAAREAFIPFLREKIGRIKHPGSLPHVAQEFTAAWPELAAQIDNHRKEAAAAEQRARENERTQEEEETLTAQVEAAWQQMPTADKTARMKAARETLKTETRWRYISAAQKDEAMQQYAKAAIRRDLEETRERMAS